MRCDPLRQQVAVGKNDIDAEDFPERPGAGEQLIPGFPVRFRPREAELSGDRVGGGQIPVIEVKRGEEQRVEFEAGQSDFTAFDFGEPFGGQEFAQQSPVAEHRVDRFADELAVAGAALPVFAQPRGEHAVGRFPGAEHRLQDGARREVGGFQLRPEFIEIEFQNNLFL